MPEQNKTEAGTPRHRQKAREKGQVLRGRDLPGAAAILAALGGMLFLLHGGLARWSSLFRDLLTQATQPTGVGVEALRQTFRVALAWTAPVMAAAWGVSLVTSMQGGVNFAAPNLLRWGRFNPANNVRNIFSPAGLSRLARSILPAGLVAYFAYAALRDNWSVMMGAVSLSSGAALSLLQRLLLNLSWKAALTLLGWAGVDYWLQYRNYEHSLRMSRQDIRDENKETQGSPETRGRIRRLQKQMHRRRMLQEVKTATVVVTNPTHFAVALRFEPGVMAAPIVVAKGRDLVAQRLRRMAVWHGVPIVENVPLAQALFRWVDVGQSIPGRFYAAVAEVLAYIYRTQRRAAQAPTLPRSAR